MDQRSKATSPLTWDSIGHGGASASRRPNGGLVGVRRASDRAGDAELAQAKNRVIGTACRAGRPDLKRTLLPSRLTRIADVVPRRGRDYQWQVTHPGGIARDSPPERSSTPG